MFTSMRNILNKEDGASLLTSKNNVNESAAPKPKEDSERNEQLRRQTTSKVRTLKKEQAKLKNTIENEFMAFKNLFLQLEDKIHKSSEEKEREEAKTSAESSELDTEFLKDVVKEAMGIERYFAEMDRKKEEIMSRLTHH
jgi:DNA replication protein DnaD